MAKAYSTIGTILKAGTTVADLEKMCHIKSYPDLEQAPEAIETTDLEDTFQSFTLGVQGMESLEFTANYTDEDYGAVKDLADTELIYQLEMGESGAQGRFRWEGTHSVRVIGGDVNAVREMVITIVPSAAILPRPVPSPVPSVTLNKTSTSIVDGSSETLTATVVPSGSTVTWASADESVATVTSGGVVTAEGVGFTDITASIKNDGTVYSASCLVTVTEE